MLLSGLKISITVSKDQVHIGQYCTLFAMYSSVQCALDPAKQVTYEQNPVLIFEILNNLKNITPVWSMTLRIVVK
jgi:hypothetical protein